MVISTIVSIEKYGQPMAVVIYIANEVLTCSPIGLLSYFIVKPPPLNPSDIFSKGPISFPYSLWLVTKKTRNLLRDFNMF
jgi:hypothetical protein